MAIFDSVKQSEFDAFSQTINSRLAQVEEKLHQLPADLIDRAQQAVSRAESSAVALSDLRVQTQSETNAVKNYVVEAFAAVNSVRDNAVAASEQASKINALTTECSDLLTKIQQFKGQSADIADDLEKRKESLSLLLNTAGELNGQVEAVTKLLTISTDHEAKIKAALTQSIEQTNQIRRLRDEVFGTEEKKEDGTTVRIEGNVDRLKNAYSELQNSTAGLQKSVNDAVSAISSEHERQSKLQQEAFDSVIRDATRENDAVVNRLKELLPGSMAAGLSSAYRAKQRVEAKSLKKLETVFGWCIGVMTLAAAVPLGINLFITHGTGSGIEGFLKFIPSLMIPMLPIYLPIFWLAYSTNKKINLSKRLIEEYTHKLVLGKTFAALTHQIQGLAGKEDVYQELQTRLLFNILQMSAENPGKLITNYNKADHPMMEALESSEKLSSAVDALGKIPGFSALATRLAKSAEAKLFEAEEKIKAGLSAADRLSEGLSEKATATK